MRSPDDLAFPSTAPTAPRGRLLLAVGRAARDLQTGLSGAGFDVVVASAPLQLPLPRGAFAVLLLSASAPQALELVRELRARHDLTPVLMVDSETSAERTSSLEVGADDAVASNVAQAELIARVRALLRRSASADVLRYADLRLDERERKVLRADQELQLTTREFALLRYLVRRAEQTVTRVDIAKEAWGQDEASSSNLVDVYVRYVRAKVDRPFPTPLIHTVRGVGYRLGTQAPP